MKNGPQPGDITIEDLKEEETRQAALALEALRHGDEVLAVARSFCATRPGLAIPGWADMEAAGLRWPAWTASQRLLPHMLAVEVVRLRGLLAEAGRQRTLWEVGT